MELLFFTSYYPYNFGDTSFIKPEMPFLSKTFNKIHVMNMLIESFQYNKIDTPVNLYLVSPEKYILKYTSKYARIKSVFSSFFHPFKLAHIFFYEFFSLLQQKKLSFQILKTSVIYLLNSNLLALLIKQYILQNPEIKIIYTYWYKYETLASLICKRYLKVPVKCITRTHGGDLYEFMQKNNYQPYKIWMDKYIDRVFFISNAGYNYYLNLFASLNKYKYIISKLGIENNFSIKDILKKEPSKDSLNIISCSGMITLKRIHLIIEALSKISELSINWTHIGDGAERISLENIANELIGNKSNIKYTFTGNLNNENVKEYYFNNYFDCFVSTTSSEGLPVSMMEAISFGIPVISSNVGGVSEIVNEETGILLNPDNCAEELVNALHKIASMSIQETKKIRESCRRYWEDNFKAETQFSKFANNLKELVEE
jgi:colanic acid/amylovoran biosynthesis glycosyltransferase